jgi:hypothetical protein
MRSILATALAIATLSTGAMAFERPTLNLGVERSLETEVNSLSVGSDFGPFGLTTNWEDTAEDNFAFNISGIDVDVSHDVGPMTVYMNNDFDSGLKHDDTSVGVSFKF